MDKTNTHQDTKHENQEPQKLKEPLGKYLIIENCMSQEI